MEYDSNYYLEAFSEFRKVDFSESNYPPLDGRSEGYISLYINGKSAIYVHDSLPCEENAIDFLIHNNQLICDSIIVVLKKDKRFSEKNDIQKELAIISASVLEIKKEEFSYVVISFLNRKSQFLNIISHKDSVIHVSKFSIKTYSNSTYEKILTRILSKKKWYQFWK